MKMRRKDIIWTLIHVFCLLTQECSARAQSGWGSNTNQGNVNRNWGNHGGHQNWGNGGTGGYQQNQGGQSHQGWRNPQSGQQSQGQGHGWANNNHQPNQGNTSPNPGFVNWKPNPASGSLKAPEKDPDICTKNADLCDHLCKPETNYPYYSCACFEGYDFHPEDNRERKECMRLCNDMEYWDPKEYTCRPVKKECKLGAHLLDIQTRQHSVTGSTYGNQYPNMMDVSKGYDLMVADPYNAIQGDPGFKSQIFSPYYEDPDSGLCVVHGYQTSLGATSVSNDYVETFTNSQQLTESFKQVAKEVNYFETSDIQVQDLDNRRKSKNINNGFTEQGTSGTSQNNGLSDTKTDSFTFSFGNSQDRSNTGTSDQSTENCLTKGNTLSIGQNWQSSVSQGGSVDQGFSEENCNTKGTSYSNTNSISAGGGASFFGLFSANMETSSSSTVGGHEENRKCQTSSTNVNSNWQAGQIQGGDVNSQQSTQTNTCGRAGYTNQKAMRTVNDMRKQAERSKQASRTANFEVNFSDMRQASIQKSTDEQLEMGKTKQYTIGGFKNGYSGSKSLENNKEFIKQYKGTVAVTQKKFKQYNAKIMRNVKPAFTTDFIKEIQKLDEFTFTWGEFDTTSDFVSKTLDKFFVEFIKAYGTHFPKSVDMGSRWFTTSRFTEEETTNTQKTDLEQCLIKYNNKKELNQETEKCVSPNGVERLMVSGHSIRRVDTKVLGDTRPDVDSISDFRTDTPVPVSMELEPIISLFTQKYMNRDQITTKEGYQIDYKAILGWFLPRYQDLCKFATDIHPDNLALQKYCQAQVFCNPQNHQCDPEYETCVPDSSEIQGYRCEAKCPNQGCPKDKIRFYDTDYSRNDYCWASAFCDKATTVDGAPGSGSLCLPTDGYGKKYCCMDQVSTMPTCESQEPICPQQPAGCKKEELHIIGFEYTPKHCMPHFMCTYVTSMSDGYGTGAHCTNNPDLNFSFKYCCDNPLQGSRFPKCQ